MTALVRFKVPPQIPQKAKIEAEVAYFDVFFFTNVVATSSIISMSFLSTTYLKTAV
jgi:hypothetical protein